jgi:hypothetical protein
LKQSSGTDHGLRGFETCSLPCSLAATRCGFSFYVAVPTSSIRGWGGRKEQGGNEGIAIVSAVLLSSRAMKFSELVRLLEQEGFRLVKEKGSIRYYAKAGHPPWRERGPDRHLPRDLESG